MAIDVRYFTDPACSWSWTAEPALRRLLVEFGDELRVTLVMGGLARSYAAPGAGPTVPGLETESAYVRLLAHWLEVADLGAMPIDPRLWTEGPIASTFPACMAVKAAAEQASDGGAAYLRALREGLMCFRRKLDTTEALAEEARRVGLDVARFRVDLGSSAIVEAFGADLEAARTVPDEARAHGKTVIGDGRERLTFPSLVFTGGDGRAHGVFGHRPYEDLRRAAEAAGARPSAAARPGVTDALRRFGRMATAEVEAVCDLPGPRAAAELWRLAAEWRVRPVRVLTGHLWELA